MKKTPIDMRARAARAATVAMLCALAGCGGGDSGGNNAGVSAAASDAGGRARALEANPATTQAVVLPQDNDPLFDGLVIADDAATKGIWSAVQPWPMNAIHAALLPTGQVLTYGTPPGNPNAQGNARHFDVWSPSLGFGDAAHNVSYDGNRGDSFCSTSGYLGDGRLMITGGNKGTATLLFNTATTALTADTTNTSQDRWYSTMLTLADGRLVVLGGMVPYNEPTLLYSPDAAAANGTVSMTPEIYTPGVGWRSLIGARSRDAFGPDFLRAAYPRAWVAPNGSIFGISAETIWSMDVAAGNGAGAVTVHGRFKTPASNTSPVNVGAASSAVMFAPGRILQVGGNGYYNADGFIGSNMATVFDINGAAPVVTETAPMAFPRRYVSTTVLPDGKVLATGGTRAGNEGGANAIFEAELWNPATGTWTVGARAAIVRVYHSNALLLPNGTVLSTGGGSPGPVQNENSEIYYPPYLFTSVNGRSQLAVRPVMNSISALKFAYGETARVQMTSTAAVRRVVLVRTGLVTHQFNTAQRWQELGFQQNGDLLTVTMPASGNLAPPGYYQLMVLDAAGVPSRAAIVAVGMSPSTAPILQRNALVALDALSRPGNGIALDTGNGLAVLAASTEASTPQNAKFTVRAGLADANCVSLESVRSPGVWLRRSGTRLQGGTGDGSAAFNGDATFCPEPGAAGSGVTLRAKSATGNVVRHRNGELWVDPQTSDADFAASASFAVRQVTALLPLPVPSVVSAPPIVSGGTASYAPNLDASGLTFSWDWGDGSAATAFASTSAAAHLYARPGLYTVTLTVRNAAGATSAKTFFQAVYRPPTSAAPLASSAMLLEPRAGSSTRLWVVNPDNDSVSVFDTATNARIVEIATGTAPRTLARGYDGRVWVVNRDSASISIIDPASLAVVQTVSLPRGSQPFGIVVNPNPNDRSALVTLEATGQVARLHGANGAVLNTGTVGANPRHLAITGAGDKLLVSRFITPPLPGEGTATVDTGTAGGQVLVLDPATLAVQSTVVLRHSDRIDNDNQGSGIPNYLGAPAISPDGTQAYVPSKLDNIKRGSLRNGMALNFQNTVRAVSSRIDMAALTETLAARLDHDNASLASAAVHDPTGSYLFVALETARQVEVLDAVGGKLLFRIEAGLAPQALVVSADGRWLYVHNMMSRSVSVVDISPLTKNGDLRSSTVATVASIGTDKLPAAVLRGKQLFYDARDPRLARDSYMSCASCHNDGGHDGRTWDFTHLGEGLRNTTALKGRAGTGQGFLHWSANFDEVQDFEGQIRAFAGGTGLMSDADFNAGTRSQALGDKKAGLSADLDALAAYLNALTSFAPSPHRNTDGSLTTAAQIGKTVFAATCASCHGGSGFTGSLDASQLKNVGTLKPTSGKRLNGALTGIDVPTLRDAWATAPYLHDGSAPTLQAAVNAHNNVALTAADLAAVVAYVQQIGSDEAPAGNLALGRPATQSSDAFGGAAARAVDGNTSGSWLDGSVTHTDIQAQPWWQVDLGQQSAVQRVQLWNRTDCCAERLANAYVFVSATDMTGRTLAQLAADTTVAKLQVASLNGAASVSLPLAAQGRFVRVQLAGTNHMNLAEVQVFGTPSVNLAQGKAASQSSEMFWANAGRAVDGNTSGGWYDNSVTHTDATAQAWWQVDLGRLAALDTVQLWNRTDCCGDRLSNFHVLASPTDMTGRTLAQLLADPAVKQVPVASLNGSATLAAAMAGFNARYVRVQLAGTNYLSLAEVQVFGTLLNPANLANLAQGKAATQASDAFGGAAGRAVDGNTSGGWYDNSVTHTDLTAQPWWQVDLGRLAAIDTVQLWNRTDCCSDRLSNVHVLASPTDMTGRTLAQLLADPSVKQVPVASLNGSATLGVTLAGFNARYVRVQLVGTNYLNLAEVQVFGR